MEQKNLRSVLVRALSDDQFLANLLSDSETTLAGYNLTPAERQALASGHSCLVAMGQAASQPCRPSSPQAATTTTVTTTTSTTSSSAPATPPGRASDEDLAILASAVGEANGEARLPRLLELVEAL